MKNKFSAVTLLCIGGIVALDQGIKWMVLRYLQPIGQTGSFLGLLRLHYVKNTGAAFSAFSGATNWLSLVTSLILLVCLILLLTKRIKPLFLHVCVAAVTAGGIGNLVDRLSRGFVVDYIEPTFLRFAVFNFADCFITVGAFAMIVYILLEAVREQRNGSQNRKKQKEARSDRA